MYIFHLHLTYMWSISANLKTKWLDWGSIFFLAFPCLFHDCCCTRNRKRGESFQTSRTALRIQLPALSTSSILTVRRGVPQRNCVCAKGSGGELVCLVLNSQHRARRVVIWPGADSRMMEDKKTHTESRDGGRGVRFFFFVFFFKPQMLPPK